MCSINNTTEEINLDVRSARVLSVDFRTLYLSAILFHISFNTSCFMMILTIKMLILLTQSLAHHKQTVTQDHVMANNAGVRPVSTD